MVAFDKQHLRECLARCIECGCVIADLLPIGCGRGAGGDTMIIDAHRAQLAVALRGEAGVMAQVGDIDIRRKCGIHNGLTHGKRDVLSVNRDGVSCGYHIMK